MKYFSSEEQGTKGEDCGHLDDGEQQLVGFHDALCLLLLDSPFSSAVVIFPFHDGHQRCGNQEHHSPKEQEVCSRSTESTNYSSVVKHHKTVIFLLVLLSGNVDT